MHQTHSQSLEFTKMQGAGNDFVVVDSLSCALPTDFDGAVAARRLCDRHFSVGADGLLLLEAASNASASVRMRMWNPDGSEDMCGNGLRCVARLAHDRGHVSSHLFVVETLAGLRPAEVHSDGLIEVGMGRPIFDPAEIPVHPRLFQNGGVLDYAVRLAGTDYRCSTLSTGSTHTIVWLEEPMQHELFGSLSPLLEKNARYPAGTSIMWTVLQDRANLNLRIWERGGCGETLACGTGACAAAVAAILTGRCDNVVTVHSKGGALKIEWAPGSEIAMTGDAQVAYHGIAIE